MEKGIGQLLQKITQMKKNQWFVLILAGILIVVIAIPVTPDGTKEKTVEKETAAVSKADGIAVLEQRLAGVLSKVEGVGNTQIMLTLKSGGKKIVEKDMPVTDKSTQEKDSEGGNRVSGEKTIGEETVYTKDAGGSQIPYVIEEMEPKVEGVIVIAEGGGNSVVVQNVTEAIMALFGVEAHKIKVMKMN